jgi:fructose-bisphosphate aldolase, class II
MPLTTMQRLLEAAAASHCAVGAFNVFNLESASGVIAAAAQTGSPCILALAESHLKYNDLKYIGPALMQMASDAAVPVAVQLDHSKTVVNVQKALDLGFSAVMWDGYDLPYEEKVQQTREIVELAKRHGAWVEAPLGRIGKVGDTAGPKYPHDGPTNPDLVADFTRRTGIHNLAVAIGSVHGMGLGGTTLDFGLLERIGRFPGAYLSLHGGSGVPDGDYQRAISFGVAKISIFTRVAMAASTAMAEVLKEETPRFPDLLVSARKGITAEVAGLMTVFNSKAAL